jgi:3-hydroxyanthranilate 3,4-dioxygenase
VLDRFNWYCDSCRSMHHQVEIHVKDIVTDLPRVMNDYAAREDLRTCKRCGHVNPAKPLRPAVTRPALAAE